MDFLSIFLGKKNSMSFDAKRDTFVMLTGMISVISFVAIFAYTLVLNESNFSVHTALVVLWLISTTFFFLVRNDKVKSVTKLSVILMVYLELILLPLLIIFGAEAKSSTPIWYAAFLMVMIVLLDMSKFWWFFVISVYAGSYLYSYIFIWNTTDARITNRISFYLSFVFSFLSIAFALSVVLLNVEKRYKQAEKAILRNHEIEDNAGKAKARFLANMTHEIRTPMNAIIGLSEIVLKDEMEDSVRSEVSIVKDSAYDLLEIIDDVLMFSKLDSKKLKLVNVDFKMDELLKPVIDTISTNSFGKDLKVYITIDHSIPKVISGDDIRIRQVIMRLVFISLSLTENGRLMLRVESKRNEDNSRAMIKIVVSDTGCGLSQVDLDAVFGAYDTYDSRQNSNLKGIGLKLSICREILSLMGGTMDIRSIEGMGLETEVNFECDIVDPEPMISVPSAEAIKTLVYLSDNRELSMWKKLMEGFKLNPDYVNSYVLFEKAIETVNYDFVFVPSSSYAQVSNIIDLYSFENRTYVVTDPSASYGDYDKCKIIREPVSCLNMADILNNNWKMEDYMSKAEDVEYDASKADILVVDDNAVNLKVASGIFKSYHVEVETAKSGEEALQKMQNKSYHLVLMDMVMPDMSGTETLKAMRSSGNKSMMDVPVVALTANTGGNIREEVLEQGFQEYLAKPIKQRYLTQILLQFLPQGKIKKIKVIKDGAKEKASNSNNKKSTAKSSQAPVAKPNVIDIPKGIKNMGDDEATYINVMSAFYKEGIKKRKEVEKAFSSKDIALFTTHVHGIKSASASIGAVALSEMFKELEFAGKDNNAEKIEKKLSAYLDSYGKILNDVKEYLISKDSFSEPLDKDAFSPEYVNKLCMIKDAASVLDIKAIKDIINDIGASDINEYSKKHLKDMSEAFSIFDFNKMAELTEFL